TLCELHAFPTRRSSDLVFKDGEVPEESNMQKMHIAGSDKPVALYSLDVIISVGYRVKSQRGVQFRQWATRTLKQHLVEGYTLNQNRKSTRLNSSHVKIS